MVADFYYGEADRLTGLLTFEDFVRRNPSRSLVDIQKWGALRKKWFEANGYSLPASERGTSIKVADKPFHVSQLDALDVLRGSDGVMRGLENMEDDDG